VTRIIRQNVKLLIQKERTHPTYSTVRSGRHRRTSGCMHWFLLIRSPIKRNTKTPLR